jgi:UDP-N-acetylmuramoyl-tripeptide--D-alanyl-D-alanine ligase
MMTLAQMQQMLPGAELVGPATTVVTRVHSDTRSLQPGDLFVALRGERFDAHDFLAAARQAGAAAALAERGLAEAGLPGLQVTDALQALQTLAAAWRRRFHLPLIAVTGSNGKTTVTQMVASILRAWVGPGACSTQGNLNNHIGLPLMLLRLRQDDTAWHRVAVFELGTNQVGEIATLARLAAPTIALVNNAQREHQEFLHGLQAVARENGAVLQALPASGTAVLPAQDPYLPMWREMAGTRRVWTFACDAPADIQGHARWENGHWKLELHTPRGVAATTLAAPGVHNLHNALAAAACALAADAPLAAVCEGLAAFEPVAGRSRVLPVTLRTGAATLVDDSYNANPDSVLAAIELLAGLPGPHWLVLGDMGEVGDQGPAFHAEVGARARERGIEHLWCAGALGEHAARAFGPSAQRFDDAPALARCLAQAPAAASVLVKGSRFMKMEQVVRALQAGSSAHGGSTAPSETPDAA